MTQNDIRAIAIRELGMIAPEADLAELNPSLSLREQLDIDSMDFLNFIVALHKNLQIDIPESDYGKLATLDACTSYLFSRVGRK